MDLIHVKLKSEYFLAICSESIIMLSFTFSSNNLGIAL